MGLILFAAKPVGCVAAFKVYYILHAYQSKPKVTLWHSMGSEHHSIERQSAFYFGSTLTLHIVEFTENQ